MADIAQKWSVAREASRGPNLLARLFDWKPFLVFLCLLPAIGLLVVFLTYPLGLGLWLAFTDTKIGRVGAFVGLENFVSLWHDPIFWTAVGNTIFYTATATIGKFALGLWRSGDRARDQHGGRHQTRSHGEREARLRCSKPEAFREHRQQRLYIVEKRESREAGAEEREDRVPERRRAALDERVVSRARLVRHAGRRATGQRLSSRARISA